MSDSHNLYVLGHPVGHSKSPVMYNAVFVKAGIPWEYGLADCATVEQAQAFMNRRAFRALNITTPYKPQALEAATVCAASARLAQGANVLVTKNDELIAYNVDGRGCMSYLERVGVSFKGASITVCGSGPTALSIVHAAAQAGACEILLVGRDEDRTRKVLEKYMTELKLLESTAIDLPASDDQQISFREIYDHTNFYSGSYATSAHLIAASDVIIDATPLGMKAGDPAPFDTSLLSARQSVFDAVYGHGTTALIAAAKKVGCNAFDGSGMLVAQAVVSVRIFCEVAQINLDLTFEELFEIMANAAGFDLS